MRGLLKVFVVLILSSLVSIPSAQALLKGETGSTSSGGNNLLIKEKQTIYAKITKLKKQITYWNKTRSSVRKSNPRRAAYLQKRVKANWVSIAKLKTELKTLQVGSLYKGEKGGTPSYTNTKPKGVAKPITVKIAIKPALTPKYLKTIKLTKVRDIKVIKTNGKPLKLIELTNGTSIPIIESNPLYAAENADIKTIINNVFPSLFSGNESDNEMTKYVSPIGDLNNSNLSSLILDKSKGFDFIDPDVFEGLSPSGGLLDILDFIRDDQTDFDIGGMMDKLAGQQGRINDILQEMIFGMDGQSSKYTDLGGGHGMHEWSHGYEAGNPQSGRTDTQITWRDTETGEWGSDSYTTDDDKNNDGKKDDNTGWDNFWDWVAGEDREDDGITTESEAGTHFNPTQFIDMMKGFQDNIIVNNGSIQDTINKYGYGQISPTQFQSKIKELVGIGGLNPADTDGGIGTVLGLPSSDSDEGGYPGGNDNGTIGDSNGIIKFQIKKLNVRF